MDLAVLINPGLARHEPVFLHRFELGVLRIAAIVLALPFGHVGVMRGLAIDGPRSAVVVRGRGARFVIDMGENLKTEAGVLIEHVQPARRLFAVPADEIWILQQVFEPVAHLFAACRT
jgi:hypothetical protein